MEVNDQNAKSAHFGKGRMAGKLAIEWLQAFVVTTKTVCMWSAMVSPHGWPSYPLQP